MPSRRYVLATGAALLGGCTQASNDRTSTGETPTDPVASDPPSGSPSTAPPNDADEEPGTVTDREPRPLDVGDAWPQFGGGPGHTGASAHSGLPDDGVPHWTVRQIRSGAPVVADGRLYHFAKLGTGDDPERVTATQTAVTTARPPGGQPAFVCRNATDGHIEWTYEFDRRRAGTAAVSDGLVVAGGHGDARCRVTASSRRERTVPPRLRWTLRLRTGRVNRQSREKQTRFRRRNRRSPPSGRPPSHVPSRRWPAAPRTRP